MSITTTGQPGDHHQVIGVDELVWPRGLCFDDQGRLYVADVAGVKRFRRDDNNAWVFDGFLCVSVYADDDDVPAGANVLPRAAHNVRFCDGKLVVSSYTEEEHLPELWVFDGDEVLLRRFAAEEVGDFDMPTFIAVRTLSCT